MTTGSRVAQQQDALPLILEMRLDGRVRMDALSAYQTVEAVLLPLGEITRQLGLAIQVDPIRGSASGYVLQEARAFGLHVERAVVSVDGRQLGYAPELVRVIDDEIYVASTALSRWLPIDFTVDMPTLQLRLHPREPLPLQTRQARESAAAKIAGPQPPEVSVFPLVREPYRLFTQPFIDQTFSANARFGNNAIASPYNAAYTAYLTADMLGLEGAAYVSAARGSADPDWRLTLSRHDPEPRLLGPLHARAVRLGDIELPAVPNLSAGASGKGWSVSNRPIGLPSSFDRQSLRGDLPPGWDLTVYYNDALVGYQQSRPDGRYALDDLPLSAGANEFVLVFNGPLGQMRSERVSFLLDAALVAPGEFLYSVTQQRDDQGAFRHQLSADFGLGPGLVLSAVALRSPTAAGTSTTTVSADSTSKDQNYAQLGLRAYRGGSILRGEINWAGDGGRLIDLGLKRRIGAAALDLQHTQGLGRFDSPGLRAGSDPLHRRMRARLLGTMRLGNGPKLPYALEAQRLELQSGAVSDSASARLSTMAFGTAMTGGVSWLRSAGTARLAGSFQISRRLASYGLSAQLGYTLAPQLRVDYATLSLDRRFDAGYRATAGLLQVFESKTTVVSTGLTKHFGLFALGLSGSLSNRRELALGLQLFMALGRDPRSGHWFADALPLANSGAIAARAYVDKNLNGIHDAGEEFIANAAFTLDGGGRQPQRTGEDGTVLLSRLAPHRYADVSLDASTLEDPQWMPRSKGVRVLPRPGRSQILDFPVVATSDIDGTVFAVSEQGQPPIGNAEVELVDAVGEVVMQTRSSGDGFYLFHQVLPGRYAVRISPAQAAELFLDTGPPRAVDVSLDSNFISGQDLQLSRRQVLEKQGLGATATGTIAAPQRDGR